MKCIIFLLLLFFVTVLFAQANTEFGMITNAVPIPGFHAPIAKINLNSRNHSVIEVPGYLWSYGCSPTAATVIMAYYDRYPGSPFSNIYTGPTNGGIMPMYNNIWGPGPCNGGQNPLCASKLGLDGNGQRGHVDDYWNYFDSDDPDPHGNYVHEPQNCVADFMGTSQEYFNLSDGRTWFAFATNGQMVQDYQDFEYPENYWNRDGCHGMRLFFEHLGYNVAHNYSQRTDGTHGQVQQAQYPGFSWSDYVDEINHGYPVLLLVASNGISPGVSHTIVACGYDTGEFDNEQIVIYRDTWDYEYHQLNWNEGPNDYVPYGTTNLYPKYATVFEPAEIANYVANVTLNPSSNNVEIQQNSTPSFSMNYSDEENGTTLDHCDWKINLYHSTGVYTYAMLNNNTTGNWSPSLGNLPTGYTWRRHPDGTIQGDLVLNAYDNNNFVHPLLRYIHLNYPPDTPQITNSNQIDNVVQLTLGIDGATSYQVYYDTDAGIPYNGTGALEGPSPVTFDSWDDITLTGLEPYRTWHISIQAVNSSGTSVLSEDYPIQVDGASSTISQSVNWNYNYNPAHPIVISSTGHLSIGANTCINLTGDSSITCESGGSLSIGNNAVIKGHVTTQVSGETNPQIIPGNFVKVNGTLTIGNDVSFISSDGNAWDGLIIDNNNVVNLSQLNFHNCNFLKKGGQIVIQSSSFDQSQIQSENSDFFIENSVVNGSIYCHDSPSVFVFGCNVIGEGDGINLTDCGDYYIYDTDVTCRTGNGITLYNTTGISAYQIEDCDITNNTGVGVRLYNSIAELISCNITNNNKGIVAYRVSNLSIHKATGTANGYRDSIISNNLWQEILYLNDTTLFINNGHNKIVDNSYNEDQFDRFLIQCPNMTDVHVPEIQGNYWGYMNSEGVALYPPANRFDPPYLNPGANEVGFKISNVWTPGNITIVDDDNELEVYLAAVDLALGKNAEAACDLFKQLITDYPGGKYVAASEKNLYALEEDKEALQDYYDNEPNLHYNGEISEITDYLANDCKIELGKYEEAIAWYEDIIADPPSELDSLLTVIDLGYVYLLMDENNKSAVTCRYPLLKPKSRIEYENNRELILSNLFNGTTNSNGGSGNSSTQIVLNPTLDKNYPNPFNPTTTISFTLPSEMKCELQIFNIKGQKVKTLINEIRTAGKQNVVWNGTDQTGKPVTSGMYFYRLVTPQSSITKKMIMLK